MQEPNPDPDPLNPLGIPDFEPVYNKHLEFITQSQFLDFEVFQEVLLKIIHIIQDALTRIIEHEDAQQSQIIQGGLYEELNKRLKIYNKAFERYKNTPLKALIVHDLKNIINATNGYISKISGKPISKEDAMILLEIVNKLEAFIKLIMLSLLNTREIASDEFILENAYRTLNQTLVINYEGEGDYLHLFKVLIWPIHTVLLNAEEKGATRVLIQVRTEENSVVVYISDDIESFGGVSGQDLLDTINLSINSETKKAGPQEVMKALAINVGIEAYSNFFTDPKDISPNGRMEMEVIMQNILDSAVDQMKIFLKDDYIRTMKRQNLSDTGQLASKNGLRIAAYFLRQGFGGDIVCLPYNGQEDFVKTFRITVPIPQGA